MNKRRPKTPRGISQAQYHRAYNRANWKSMIELRQQHEAEFDAIMDRRLEEEMAIEAKKGGE